MNISKAHSGKIGKNKKEKKNMQTEGTKTRCLCQFKYLTLSEMGRKECKKSVETQK